MQQSRPGSRPQARSTLGEGVWGWEPGPSGCVIRSPRTRDLGQIASFFSDILVSHQYVEPNVTFLMG